jgi:MarR family transcriptional regulator for hemolysin
MSMHHHEPDLLMLLNDVGRMLRTEADRRARAHGMTRAQWVMLIRLERQPGLSQKELAELLEVEPITVARLADRLEARNLLERRPDPQDRRIWRLHLLPDAQPVLDELAAQRDELMHLLTAKLDPATVETVTSALFCMRCTLSRRSELEIAA